MAWPWLIEPCDLSQDNGTAQPPVHMAGPLPSDEPSPPRAAGNGKSTGYRVRPTRVQTPPLLLPSSATLDSLRYTFSRLASLPSSNIGRCRVGVLMNEIRARCLANVGLIRIRVWGWLGAGGSQN